MDITELDAIKIIAEGTMQPVRIVKEVYSALTEYAAHNKDIGSIEGFCPESIDDLHHYAKGTTSIILDGMNFYGPVINGRIIPLKTLVDCELGIRKKRQKSTEPSWSLLRLYIFERDGYVCQYCGKHIDKPHCDHVFPLCRGGKSVPENLVTACPECNTSKGSKTLEEWRGPKCLSAQ